MRTYRSDTIDILNGNDIYSGNSDGNFISPFNLSIDDMEQLILVNFEKDPDKYYNTFELQQACDKDGRKKYLVIAYRIDGSSDVYHQPAFPFASQANILNDATFIENALEDVRFEIKADRMNVFFSFIDKIGRQIEVKVNENNRQKKKPFFLLAPVGVISRKPGSLPVYSLYEMAFTKQKYTEILIEIDNVKHKPDIFQLPLEYSKNYFTRYSADTFNVDWNRNFDGPIPILKTGKNNSTEAGGTLYELTDNNGHYEIKRMIARNRQHKFKVEFQPAIPDILCLREKIQINGNFNITTDESPGIIRGKYRLQRDENEVYMVIHPEGGWIPNEPRWGLKLLFFAVKIFRDWPKSYIWNAKIKLDETDLPIMKSGWKRVTSNADSE